MQQEELRALVKDKLLAVLPAVSFQALLDYAVPGEMGRELEEYGEVLVAAQEAARVTELLRALGAGADELRKVSSVWGIAIRNASGGTRAAQSVRSELRGACVRFLKETPVSDASGGAEQGMTAFAVARAGEGTSPSSSGALVEQSVQVTLAMLLEAAPADVRAEFKHLGSCVLGDLAAAQAEEAENLIGLDEAAENDPLQHYIVVQEQVCRLQEDQARIQRKEEKVQAAEGEARVVAGMQLTAARETCRGHVLELREVSRRLWERHEQEIEKELQLQLLEKSQGSNASVVLVQAGQLLSMFVPESWCLAFTEFFFGDCLPFDRRRPVRLAPHAVMAALLKREELQYHLYSDATPYAALPTSRWDSPEVTAMFADTLRRQNLLGATRMTFLSQESFKVDLQAIARAKAEDFQELQHYSTLGQAYASATNRDRPAMKALQHLLSSTAVVPLTEGHKMKLRHFGHALDMTFGPLKLLLTRNFADTYMPLTMTIFDGTNMEQLASKQCDLLVDRPGMPPLQQLHRAVARSPVTQARLFLLMEEIVLTQILGVEAAFIGQHVLEFRWGL